MSVWPNPPKTSHCKRGHERTFDTIYILPNGTYACRPCKNKSAVKYQKSHRSVYRRVNDKAQNKDRFGGNRELVIQRDGEKCVVCGMTRQEHRDRWAKDITVDHIDGLGRYTSRDERNNDTDNLQTLCLRCHGRKDNARRGLTLTRSTT